MKPCLIPKLSRRIFAIGPTEFVVQDAFEMMWCFSGSYASSLTPRTSVMSGSVAGAEMTTLSAPAVRCWEAPSRLVKSPVDLDNDVTSMSFQGSAAGSRSRKHAEGIAVYGDLTFRDVDLVVQPAVRRVVPQQVREHVGRGQVVDRDDLEARILVQERTVEVAPDAAETVDADPLSHVPPL
jgi:hypothetical protein